MLDLWIAQLSFLYDLHDTMVENVEESANYHEKLRAVMDIFILYFAFKESLQL